MDKLETYRNHIIQILQDYKVKPANLPDVEPYLFLDKERDHYQLLLIGWHGEERIFAPSIHIDLINEKIWIQKNDFDFLIENYLLKMGVPKQDIVLGVLPLHMRKYTEFALS